jgi:hypothetical protein
LKPDPPQPTLSEFDLGCLQMGRRVMAESYRVIARQITGMADQLEQVSVPLPPGAAIIRPAMARTMQLIGAAVEMPPARRGKARRGKTKRTNSQGIRHYWANMTKQERSAEIKRRHAVSAAKKSGKKLHPRDKAHPDHERWLANVAKAARKTWEGLSPRQKKRRSGVLKRAQDAARKARNQAIPTVAMMGETA